MVMVFMDMAERQRKGLERLYVAPWQLFDRDQEPFSRIRLTLWPLI